MIPIPSFWEQQLLTALLAKKGSTNLKRGRLFVSTCHQDITPPVSGQKSATKAMLALGLTHHHARVIQVPTQPTKAPSHALTAALAPTHLLLPPPKYVILVQQESIKKPPKLPFVFLLSLDTIKRGQLHKSSARQESTVKESTVKVELPSARNARKDGCKKVQVDGTVPYLPKETLSEAKDQQK